VKLTVAWIGKTRSSAVGSLTEDYLRRLRQYADAEGVSLKDENALPAFCGRPRRGVRSRLVLVDRRGEELSSEQLADFLRRQQDEGRGPLVFAIGPADGFTSSVLAQADFTLSLGKMTIAHELARVLLLEQLYRAFTILRRHPYHLGHG
jgi:23S rRNA (pseudouridine1915-N3)-methyltransferase